MSALDHSLEHNNRGHVCEFTLQYFKTKFNCQTLLDVGAGVGLNCGWAQKYFGYQATGIEADGVCQKVHNDIVIHDFEKDGVCDLGRTFDLGWSVATSEHIDSSGAIDYAKTFLQCKYVVFTWCNPGYGGYHHVNEQYLPYWLDIFLPLGFVYDEKLSRHIRKNNKLTMIKNLDSMKEKNKKYYLRKWGTVFINSKFI